MYNNLTISLVHEWIKPIKLLAMNHISTLSMHLKLHHNPYCRPCHPPYTGDGAWRPTRLCCVGGWRGAQSHYGGCPSLGSHHHTPSQGESLATMLGDAPSYHRLCAVRGNAHRRWRHGSLCISVPAIYEVRYVWTPNLDLWVFCGKSRPNQQVQVSDKVHNGVAIKCQVLTNCCYTIQNSKQDGRIW